MGSRAGVEVRAFLHLAGLVGERGHVVLPSQRGATVSSVAREAGLDPASVGLVMVNGIKAELHESVGEGDRVAFFPDYVPYHRVYGMCVL